MTNEPEIIVEVDTKNIDAAIEKVKRLMNILRDAQNIINSLCGKQDEYIQIQHMDK